MTSTKIITRDNNLTDEISEKVKKTFKGIELEYNEVYYLDKEVDEETGSISNNYVKYYTKNQMERNLKALKTAYNVAKGAVSPDEIVCYRKRLKLSATNLSSILGFSKNTITNIEKEGILSLPTGRLIKQAIKNKDIMIEYVKFCDELDDDKKNKISKNILEKI